MAGPNRFLTTAAGAFPGRKPGKRNFVAYRRAALSSASATVSAGTRTSRWRAPPSDFFVVISSSIANKIMGVPRNAAWRGLIGRHATDYPDTAATGDRL